MEEESVTENVRGVHAGRRRGRASRDSRATASRPRLRAPRAASSWPPSGPRRGGLAAPRAAQLQPAPGRGLLRAACCASRRQGRRDRKANSAPWPEEGGESPPSPLWPQTPRAASSSWTRLGAASSPLTAPAQSSAQSARTSRPHLQGLFQSAAGEVYAMTPKPEGGGIDLHAIDLGSKKLGQTVHSLSYGLRRLPPEAAVTTPAGNEGESFCALRLGAQPGKAPQLINCDINSSLSSAASSRGRRGPLPAQRLRRRRRGSTSSGLSRLRRPGEAQTTLSLACNYLDYDVRRAVLDFNRKNAEFRIEVRDYSQYNTDEDYGAGSLSSPPRSAQAASRISCSRTAYPWSPSRRRDSSPTSGPSSRRTAASRGARGWSSPSSTRSAARASSMR